MSTTRDSNRHKREQKHGGVARATMRSHVANTEPSNTCVLRAGNGRVHYEPHGNAAQFTGSTVTASFMSLTSIER